MKREGLLEELLKRRKLGIMLVVTGLAFIFLFCSYLILYVQVNGPAPSCRTSPLVVEKSQIEIMSCVADSAQSQERGLLLVPVAIAGGALVAGGAGVLLYPFSLSAPQRARDATWDAFAPRAEFDLGPALLK
jgi:Na+-transporting methylmalonyl-CoA/oxaloacetate decarboxylase gamma subunit